MRSLLKNLLFQVNLFVALGLLFTYTAPYLSPAIFWPAGIVGLLYPFFLFINLIFVLLWLIRRNKLYAMLSIAAIVTGWPILQTWFALNLFGPQNAAENTSLQHNIKVMSYNVRNFDLYSWEKNIQTRNQMIQFIKAENPDIVAFQDFFTQDDSELDNIALLTQTTELTHYYFDNTLTLRDCDRWGAAIFSKYPLSNFQHIKFEDARTNTIAIADALVEGQTIRIFSAHLQSNFLAKKDIRYVSDLIEQKDDNNGANNTKNNNNINTIAKLKKHAQSLWSIVSKLRNGLQKRGLQANQFAESIAQSPYPILVCGDFNDTPISYTYKKVASQARLKDTFLSTGLGLGNTYHGLSPLAFRIDYIFVDNFFKIEDFDIIYKKYSDHYPVVARLVW